MQQQQQSQQQKGQPSGSRHFQMRSARMLGHVALASYLGDLGSQHPTNVDQATEQQGQGGEVPGCNTKNVLYNRLTG